MSNLFTFLGSGLGGVIVGYAALAYGKRIGRDRERDAILHYIRGRAAICRWSLSEIVAGITRDGHRL